MQIDKMWKNSKRFRIWRQHDVYNHYHLRCNSIPLYSRSSISNHMMKPIQFLPNYFHTFPYQQQQQQQKEEAAEEDSATMMEQDEEGVWQKEVQEMDKKRKLTLYFLNEEKISKLLSSMNFSRYPPEEVKKLYNAKCSFLGSITNFDQSQMHSVLTKDELFAQKNYKLPSFAFVGRSNVGKSTLLNAVLIRKNLVKTSKRPGQTQALNVFGIEKYSYFIDMPGYGYAAAPLEEVKKWKKLIHKFISIQTNKTECPRLCMVYLLLDARRDELKKADKEFLSFLISRSVPFTVILTKIDKIELSEVPSKIQLFLEQLSLQFQIHDKSFMIKNLPTLIATSAKEKIGINILQNDILYHVLAHQNDESYHRNISSPIIQENTQLELQETTNVPQIEKKKKDVQSKEKSTKDDKKKKVKQTPAIKQFHSPYIFESKLLESRANRTAEQAKSFKRIEKVRAKRISIHNATVTKT